MKLKLQIDGIKPALAEWEVNSKFMISGNDLSYLLKNSKRGHIEIETKDEVN